jgi:hypothetical protein
MEKKKPVARSKAPRRDGREERRETRPKSGWQKDPRVEPLERR